MRIALISTSYPVSDNGSEAAGSFVKDFVDELISQGHEVAVIVPCMNSNPKNATKKLGLHYFWFVVPKLPLSLLTPKKPQDWWPVFKTLQQGKKAVDRAVVRFQPDHIFALWALPSGHWARYAKKKYGVPYSIWALGSDIWSLGKIPIVNKYLRKVLQEADQCFADGHKLSDDVTKISNKSCKFLPSTRQLPVCGLPQVRSNLPLRLCFLGRWHPNKGIDLLLEALQLFSGEEWKKIEEVRIAGGGVMENLVKEQVSKLQEKRRPVTLLGYQDKFGAGELLIWSDYVIIPSRVESIPVIFSDALQANRPVIATPVGDLSSLLEEYKCGIRTEGVIATDIAKAIRNALSETDSNFRQTLDETRQVFELKTITKKFVDVITTSS